MIPNDSLIVSSTEPTGKNRKKVWIQKGKNLLNKYALINAALNEVNGKLEQNNTRLASEFLFLKAGTYTISCNLSRFAYVKYNLNKTFNSFISWNTLPNQIVLNSDCYIRIEFIGDENGSINISKSNIETLQLEGGSNLTTYEDYIEPKIYIRNNNDVYEKLEYKYEDTGWKDISLKSGYSLAYDWAPCKIRKIGDIVQIRGYVKGFSSIQYTEFANIPIEYCPSYAIQVFNTIINDCTKNALLNISELGVLSFTNANFTPSQDTAISINAMYLV